MEVLGLVIRKDITQSSCLMQTFFIYLMGPKTSEKKLCEVGNEDQFAKGLPSFVHLAIILEQPAKWAKQANRAGVRVSRSLPVNLSLSNSAASLNALGTRQNRKFRASTEYRTSRSSVTNIVSYWTL